MNSTVRAETRWPTESLESVERCPVCQSASRVPLHAGLVDDTFFTAAGTWSLHQCTGCLSAYLDPRPTQDSIGTAYAAYYTHAGTTSESERGLKRAARRILRWFSDAYVASLEATPSLRASVVRAVPPCREIIDARYRHLRRPKAGADRLVDIGCGGGDFLLRARQLGWRAEGVDFDPKAVAAAQAAGLDVMVGSIDAYAGVQDAFDVVTCNHVIEHVYDARYLVEAMHRILKPGGRLWIETPNIGSQGHRAFGKAWRGLETPRHLTIFEHAGLRTLLQEAGFTVTHQTPWNFQHIRMMYSASEAIATGGDPHNTRTPLLPGPRLLKGLLVELLCVERREFSCFRAIKNPRT